jgi:hypothetical protein
MATDHSGAGVGLKQISGAASETGHSAGASAGMKWILGAAIATDHSGTGVHRCMPIHARPCTLTH